MKDIRARILWWALKRRIARDKPSIIAITGSFAKTSTKEAVKCVLEAAYPGRVSSTWGNLNTQLGVPLGVLGFQIDFYKQRITWQWLPILINAVFRSFNRPLGKYLIVELGVDRPGEMEFFTNELQYEIAVITRLGEAHLVNFPSVNDYWHEKSLIAKGLKEGGLLIVNSADSQIEIPKVILEKIKVEKFSCADKAIAFTVARLIGHHFNIEQSLIEESLSQCVMPLARMTIYRGNEITLMDDSYNASPQSMVSALEWLNEGDKPKRRVAILGDMLELGERELEYHKDLGKIARENADIVIAVGQLARNYSYDYHYPNSREAAKGVIALLEQGDKILVKGSHGVHMEIIVEAIKNELL